MTHTTTPKPNKSDPDLNHAVCMLSSQSASPQGHPGLTLTLLTGRGDLQSHGRRHLARASNRVSSLEAQGDPDPLLPDGRHALCDFGKARIFRRVVSHF